MWRDLDEDVRREDRERPEPGRGGRANARDDDHDTHPTAALVRHLDLPRGPDRERVHTRTKSYELRGAEARTLATVGAFRVVPADDLRAAHGGRQRDLRHLQDLALIRTQPYVVGKTRTTLAMLTAAGRALLEEARRDRDDGAHQAFYAGVLKPRELAHDAHLYKAYVRAAARLSERGGRIRRVVLEEELKRDYQRFLHATDRGRQGRPTREPEEIAEWARTHQLPIDDDHVQFPDLRIEYEDRDGRREVEDVEVTTPHYRGAHAAAKVRAGFTRYRAIGACLGGGGRSGRGGGRGFDPRVAEDVLA